MSIVRLSVLHSRVFAPYPDGNLDMAPYTRRRGRGLLGELARPRLAPANAPFRRYLRHAVAEATSELPEQAPVLVMVHGFLFDPKVAVSPKPEDTDNPHGRVFHFLTGDEADEQRHHTSSWPVGLGFEEGDRTGRSGLAVAFGWQSQPGFASSLINHFQNFYARAYENAGEAAWVLVNLIRTLAEELPGRRIDIACHSLGARVVLRAIALAAKEDFGDAVGALDRVIILGGAEYVVEASLMMRRLRALGRAPSFYNIVSRENDVLDKLGENFGPRTFGNSQVVGHNGLDVETPPPEWLDIQIDSRAVQEWMAHRGIDVSGDRADNVWDHWYYFTYRGNMDLYRAILRDRPAWAIDALRTAGIPDRVSRRWSIFGD